MKDQSKFAISRFENRNGVTSWRVDGRLHGVRFRKNFKTKEEAAAEKAALDLRAVQAASGIRPTTTFLTDTQDKIVRHGYVPYRVQSQITRMRRLNRTNLLAWRHLANRVWRRTHYLQCPRASSPTLAPIRHYTARSQPGCT